MKKMASLKKNILYQGSYQAFMLVIPLIISPYVTRVLGGDALGEYTFTNTNAYYFVLVAMLGIARHGQRAIAAVRDDETQLRRVFWSLEFVHACASLIALLSYVIFIFVFSDAQYRVLYVIQVLYVLSALFDVTWFFYGLEDFKSVILRNFIIKVSELLGVFLCIKGPDDIGKYALIVSASVLCGQLVMLPQMMKRVPPIRFEKKDVFQHLKPLFTLALSVIAVALYTVFDKTLLGMMTKEKKNVAFYEYADKLVRVPISLIAAIGTVTYPRMCHLLSENKEDKAAKNIFDQSIALTAFLAFGAITLFLGGGEEFGRLYYGQEFEVSGSVMLAMSPIILFITVGDIFRTQILIPRKKDSVFVLIICINAIVNLLLSIYFIPMLGIYGAVLGTCVAEFLGFALCLIFSRKYIPISSLLSELAPFLIIAGLGVLAAYGMKWLPKMQNAWLSFGFRICAQGLLYVGLCMVWLWNKKREMIKLLFRS